MYQKLSEEQRAELGQRYKNGETIGGLATAYGIADETVYRWLRDLGIPSRNTRRNGGATSQHSYKLSAQQLAEIGQRYQAGENPYELCHDYGVHSTTIYHALEKLGIATRQAGYPRQISPVQAAEMGILYQAGKSTQQLAKRYRVSDGTIHNYLEANGIPRRPRGSQPRYHCNWTFFDTIDSEEKAYFLGFLAADGNVSDNASVSLYISEVDKEHLYRFRKALQSNHPVKDVKYNPDKKHPSRYVVFSITSRIFANSLAKYGIIPRKSFTVPYPALLPHLNRHFIRGYIDGDGCWYQRRHTQQHTSIQYGLSMVGNVAFLTALQQILMAACQLRATVIGQTATKGIGHLSYGGNTQMARIATYIYNEATIYLPRKWQKIAPLLRSQLL